MYGPLRGRTCLASWEKSTGAESPAGAIDSSPGRSALGSNRPPVYQAPLGAKEGIGLNDTKPLSPLRGWGSIVPKTTQDLRPGLFPCVPSGLDCHFDYSIPAMNRWATLSSSLRYGKHPLNTYAPGGTNRIAERFRKRRCGAFERRQHRDAAQQSQRSLRYANRLSHRFLRN